MREATFRIIDDNNTIKEVTGWRIKNTSELPSRGFPYSQYLEDGEFPIELCIYFKRMDRKRVQRGVSRSFVEKPICDVHDYRTGIKIPNPVSPRGSRFDGTPTTPNLVNAWMYIIERIGIEELLESLREEPTLNE